MSAPVVFVDTETTGLDAERHEIWEVALVPLLGEARVWQLHVDLRVADPISLSIGRFHSRHRQGNDAGTAPILTPAGAFAWSFGRLTHGVHLAGAVVSFDEERLRKLLLREGVVPSWHYHLVDVEALAAGKLGAEPPWDSEQLSYDVGVDPEKFERHTAWGDARWARAIYEAVMPREEAAP